jgi:ATP-dependent RNA helicase RhlE
MESLECTQAPEAGSENLFAQLGLAAPLVAALVKKGYTQPTPIQEQAIPLLLAGKDVIGGSQTGTGKTAAFGLPILQILEKSKGFRALILEPTRELAQQVDSALRVYAANTNLKFALLYGGVKYGRQREQLDAGPDIVVATPGRLMDHLQQGNLKLDKIEILVLDEADRMLDLGFLPAVRRIIALCPKKRQNLLFSATVPRELEKLAKSMLHEPETLRMGRGNQAAETIKHVIYPVDDRQKFDLLQGILQSLDFKSVLIFCRTRVGADVIARWLSNSGHGTVGVLHSDRSQTERDRALGDFKSGVSSILVATDIVARGIDISGISHVINYDIPQNPEDYVHRIGRTGRANNEGDAVTLVTAGEVDFLRSIERFIGQTIEQVKLEGFAYNWTPTFDAAKTIRKKRNR